MYILKITSLLTNFNLLGSGGNLINTRTRCNPLGGGNLCNGDVLIYHQLHPKQKIVIIEVIRTIHSGGEVIVMNQFLENEE